MSIKWCSIRKKKIILMHSFQIYFLFDSFAEFLNAEHYPWEKFLDFFKDNYNFILSRHILNFWRARQLCFFYVQILTELKNRFVLKYIDLIYWRLLKVKILYKISGMKFSSLELKLSSFAMKPPSMKGLKEYVCLCVSRLACEKTAPRRASKSHKCVHLGFRLSNFLLLFILLTKNNSHEYVLKSRDEVVSVNLSVNTLIFKWRGLQFRNFI